MSPLLSQALAAAQISNGEQRPASERGLFRARRIEQRHAHLFLIIENSNLLPGSVRAARRIQELNLPAKKRNETLDRTNVNEFMEYVYYVYSPRRVRRRTNSY